MAKVNEGPLPPYVAYSTLQKMLEDLGRDAPSQFDSSYYDRLKLSGSNRSALKNAMVFLGLCTREGKPTEALQQLLKSDGDTRKSMLQVITRQAYGHMFTRLEIDRATTTQLKDYFKSMHVSTEIGRKCMSFFLAISKDAGIRLSPMLQQAVPGTRGKKTASKSTSKKVDILSGPFETPNYLAPLLIKKFPDFDPAWPQDTKHKWFDDFVHLVNKLCGPNQIQPPAL